MAVTVDHYVALAGILFTIGAVAVLVRRNVFIVLMGVELMLNAANLAVVAYARTFADHRGHALAFIVMAVAAAEAAVGLALVVRLFRQRETVHLDEVRELRG